MFNFLRKNNDKQIDIDKQIDNDLKVLENFDMKYSSDTKKITETQKKFLEYYIRIEEGFTKADIEKINRFTERSAKVVDVLKALNKNRHNDNTFDFEDFEDKNGDISPQKIQDFIQEMEIAENKRKVAQEEKETNEKKEKEEEEKKEISNIIEQVRKFEAKDEFLNVEENGKPAFMNYPIPENEKQKYQPEGKKQHTEIQQVGTNEQGEPVFLVKSIDDNNYYFVDKNNVTYNFGTEKGKFTVRNFGFSKIGGNSKIIRKSRRNFSKRKTYKGAKRRKSNKKSKKTYNLI